MANNANKKEFPSVSINWSKGIFGKSVTNPYKSRDL